MKAIGTIRKVFWRAKLTKVGDGGFSSSKKTFLFALVRVLVSRYDGECNLDVVASSPHPRKSTTMKGNCTHDKISYKILSMDLKSTHKQLQR